MPKFYLNGEYMGTQRYETSLEVFNSISPSNHVIFCLLYKHLTNKKSLVPPKAENGEDIAIHSWC